MDDSHDQHARWIIHWVHEPVLSSVALRTGAVASICSSFSFLDFLAVFLAGALAYGFVYADSTSFAGPSMMSSPLSMQGARSHTLLIVEAEWLTRNTVPARSRISVIRSWLRSLKAASPVANASSIIKTSGTAAVEIAKRR